MTDQQSQETPSFDPGYPAIVLFLALVVLLAVLLAARSDGDETAAEIAAGPTATPSPVVLEFTSTPRPATATPTPIVLPGGDETEEPTQEPTVAPTQEPTVVVEPSSTPVPDDPETEEPTETEEAAPTEADTASTAGDIAASGNAANGKALFAEFQPLAGFACATCHLVDSEAMLIGPGLANIAARAAERVPGQSAHDYLVESIVNPNAYVVSGFTPNLMPQNFADIFSEDEIADIVAYLGTLGG